MASLTKAAIADLPDADRLLRIQSRWTDSRVGTAYLVPGKLRGSPGRVADIHCGLIRICKVTPSKNVDMHDNA